MRIVLPIIAVAAVIFAGCYFLPRWLLSSTFLSDTANTPAARIAFVAAILAFLSGVLGPAVQLIIGSLQASASQTSADAAMLTAKTAGAREIAKLRLSWMDTLRKSLTEYHSILMNLSDKTETESEVERQKREADLEKLVLLGTELDLMLNQDDHLQKKLWDVTDEIYNLPTSEARQAKDVDLIAAGRAVLKAEWEKVKAEMRGGAFQTGV
jgi:hypothetical protein